MTMIIIMMKVNYDNYIIIIIIQITMCGVRDQNGT